MGTCCSQEALQPVNETVNLENPIQSKPFKRIPDPHPKKYRQVFWATPVFLYNSTVPRDGYIYTSMYPVEPFRAQRYTIKNIHLSTTGGSTTAYGFASFSAPPANDFTLE